MLNYNSSALHPVQGFDHPTKEIICRTAWSLVGKAGLTRSDVDDLEQELSEALLRAQQSFDRTIGPWPNFAQRVLTNESRNIIRDRCAEKRDFRRESLVSELTAGSTDGEFPFTDASDPVALKQLTLDLDAASQALPAKLQHLYPLMQSLNVTEIADSLGGNRETIRDRVQKVRHLLRKGISPSSS